MPKLRVHCFSVSLDGYAAGPDQSLEDPLGRNGEELHRWMFETRTGRAMQGLDDGGTGVDDQIVAAGDAGIGATIMGRNMFGPVRGSWPDDEWRGWWGEAPPYHHDVFVLTHHPREPVSMQGGTTFHFVTDGIESALDHAFAAAGGADVRLGGGASTVQQYLRAGLIDELQFTYAPVLLGTGERLFAEPTPPGYEVAEVLPSASAVHVRLVRTGS